VSVRALIVVTISGGDFGVIEYRAYYVGHDGHFNGYEPLVCANDAAAIDMAKRIVIKHGIELWSGPRFVVKLDPESPPK
jgi:hypothetical protein